MAVIGPTLPPDCAEKFRAERLLASGGFGAVLLATQIELARPAAIKILRTDTLDDPEEVRRFVNEARITATLSHPNIIKVFDHGAAAGIPWIAYEYVDGPDVRAVLDEARLDLADGVEIALQVAQALCAAHAIGVLHRDIKPENVLRAQPGFYKVTDFGIAKWSRDCAVRTRTGLVVGTPAYMSPEQIQGLPPKPASDVYALGVMLFELTTGQLPFTGQSPILVLERHLSCAPVRPSAISPQIPTQLDAIILRAMAKRPEDRFVSAAAFAQALEPLRHHSAMTAQDRTATVSARHGEMPETVRLGRVRHASPSPRSRPHPAWIVIPLAVVLALGIWALGGRSRPGGVTSPAVPPRIALGDLPGAAARLDKAVEVALGGWRERHPKWKEAMLQGLTRPQARLQTRRQDLASRPATSKPLAEEAGRLMSMAGRLFMPAVAGQLTPTDTFTYAQSVEILLNRATQLGVPFAPELVLRDDAPLPASAGAWIIEYLRAVRPGTDGKSPVPSEERLDRAFSLFERSGRPGAGETDGATLNAWLEFQAKRMEEAERARDEVRLDAMSCACIRILADGAFRPETVKLPEMVARHMGWELNREGDPINMRVNLLQDEFERWKGKNCNAINVTALLDECQGLNGYIKKFNPRDISEIRGQVEDYAIKWVRCVMPIMESDISAASKWECLGGFDQMMRWSDNFGVLPEARVSEVIQTWKKYHAHSWTMHGVEGTLWRAASQRSVRIAAKIDAAGEVQRFLVQSGLPDKETLQTFLRLHLDLCVDARAHATPDQRPTVRRLLDHFETLLNAAPTASKPDTTALHEFEECRASLHHQ